MDIVSFGERPDLEEEASAAFREKWPEFIFHDPVSKQYLAQVGELFGQYDVLLLDEDRVVAGGWGVPIRWDPLTSMATFATWTRADGLSIDPWIRAHQRMGATILAPCARSMVITGTVAQWQSWTDMVFPETGRYVVPDALGLVDVNTAEDTGTYVEEGLWVQHL